NRNYLLGAPGSQSPDCEKSCTSSKVVCAETLSKPPGFGSLRLQLSERQIPQVVGFIRSVSNQREPLERAAVLVRQALYPTELTALKVRRPPAISSQQNLPQH